MAELIEKSACEIVALLKAGDISSGDTLDALEARIEQVDSGINALPTLCFERARQAARQVDQSNSVLAGIPIAIKDLTDVAGVRTTYGSMLYENHVPEHSDILVERLETEGGVVYAKSNTPEFGTGGNTFNDVFGATHNPYDLTRSAGGSSGGAAAALASGSAWLAQGSDLGGSLRTPASFCGVFGLKPSYGRVPVWPPTPFGTFASTGPMTRTVADAALMLSVIAEPDARDWNALPYDRCEYGAELDDGIESLRIAYSPTLGYAEVDREVAKIVETAVEALNAQGATVERQDPGFADPAPFWHVLFRGLTAYAFKDMTDAKLAVMDPMIADKIRASRGQKLETYLDAERQRAELGAHMKTFHESYDLLITPATAVAAFPVGRATPDRTAQHDATEWPFSLPFNLTRQPAASVPCGFTADGRPVGLQIVGQTHCDTTVLRAARAFEMAQPWAGRRPAVATSTDGMRTIAT